MSCPYANQQPPTMRGGAGAAEYVQSVAGGPGQQSAISPGNNTIKLTGGRRRSKRRNVLSRILNIVGNRRRHRTRRGSQKRHRRRTYRK